MSHLPSFRSMPTVEGMPHGCAWGLWDTDGKRDQNGTLNLITPETILAAKSEIRDGKSVALNWAMQHVANPGFGRKALERNIIELRPFKAHDEEIAINTQAGSQWDGFKHWAHQSSALYYNGLAHEDVASALDNGIHHWTDRGGIVGRGVLLDYVAHAARTGVSFDAWTRHEITVQDLEAMCTAQGVELKPADVLIVRSGFVKRYNEANVQAQIEGIQHNHSFVGLQGCEDMVEWLWNHHFAAVAGDTIALEAWPPTDPWILHDFLLALWGSPIGELWNLEELAEECARRGRYSFFFTSAPLNIIGGVASPPNALAIF